MSEDAPFASEPGDPLAEAYSLLRQVDSELEPLDAARCKIMNTATGVQLAAKKVDQQYRIVQAALASAPRIDARFDEIRGRDDGAWSNRWRRALPTNGRTVRD